MHSHFSPHWPDWIVTDRECDLGFPWTLFYLDEYDLLPGWIWPCWGLSFNFLFSIFILEFACLLWNCPLPWPLNTWLILSMVLEAAVSSPCPGLTHTGLPVLNLLPVLESVFLCRSEPCPGVFLLLWICISYLNLHAILGGEIMWISSSIIFLVMFL